MRLYAITMFIHILGVIALFGGFAMMQRFGAQLRRASTTGEARRWTELFGFTRGMLPGGAVMLLVTGAYLSFRLTGGIPDPWVMVAATTVLLIAIVVIAVVFPAITEIVKTLPDRDEPLSPEAARRIGSGRLWGALAGANGAALGTLWLMTARPSLQESLIAVLLPAIIGAIIGTRLGARASHRPSSAQAAPSWSGVSHHAGSRR